MQTTDASLQLAVTTMSAGYAAAIAGRNAGRPFIAVGQLTFTTLPMAIALLVYPDWVHKVLGFVVLMFIYGMIDITLCIRDIIIQALTMTRKEAALAARFEEQAKRFDIALNNMSHGLCMLDQQDRLQVWNERFLELLHLQNAPVRVGMRISQSGPPQHPRRQSQGPQRQGGLPRPVAQPAARTASTRFKPRPTAIAPSRCRAG